MSSPQIKFTKAPSSEVAAWLRSEQIASVVRRATDDIAAHVPEHTTRDGEPIPVKSRVTTTGRRARGTVALAHPAGHAEEAKHGLLSHAVTAAGLTLKGDDK
jgi:hypothetical protein